MRIIGALPSWLPGASDGNGGEMTKIISPIKSVEGARRVAAAGADEVYVGVRIQGLKFMSYSGRKAACCIDNYDDLAEACRLAHEHGTEVNLAANLPFMTDLLTPIVKSYIKHSVEAGIDALIIGDMGTLLLVRDMGIDLPVYASSYFVARNLESVHFLQKLGVTRLITSPDSTMEEIRGLVERSPIEVEAFVHGEGCSNVGGNCYLIHSQRPKAYAPYDDAPASPIASQKNEDTSLVSISDRIPCLFDYQVRTISDRGVVGPAESLPIMDSFSYCSMCFVEELVHMGVGGLKIVGRCASEDFQERTTSYYRRLVDMAKAENAEAAKMEIQRLRSRSPEMMKLCVNKRCFYAPWSGKARDEFQVPHMEDQLTLVPLIRAGAAAIFSTVQPPTPPADAQGD
jgi:putative protease